MRDPASLPFVSAQVEGIYDNATEHLTREQIAQDRASAQRAVHRAALDTQVERAPEKVLSNLAQDALQPLVRQGALDAADLALARQRARRAVKRRAQLEGATKRKAFADFRANLEIAARRGEVGQKFIDRQHELGAITAAERNRYVQIAKRVRERREEAAAQRRELEALKAGGGTVGAAVLRGIRTNLDGLIAAGARDPELVRFALEAGAITKEGARKRLERMRAGEAKITEREALVERGRRADKEPLDPTNPQDRKAAELHYRRDVKARFERMAGNPAQAKQLVKETVAFVKKTGVAPKALLGALERGLSSDDPKIKTVSAAVFTAVARQTPEQVPYPAGDPKLTFAAAVDTNREAGFKPAAAVKKAETEVVKATPEDKRDRAEVYDRDRKAIEAQNRQFLKELGLSERHLPAFNTEAERLYTQSGDINVARQRAFVAVLRGAEGQPATTGITPTGPGSETAVRQEIEQNGQAQAGAVSGVGSEAATRTPSETGGIVTPQSGAIESDGREGGSVKIPSILNFKLVREILAGETGNPEHDRILRRNRRFFFAGFNKGLADTIDSPTDLLNGVLGTLLKRKPEVEKTILDGIAKGQSLQQILGRIIRNDPEIGPALLQGLLNGGLVGVANQTIRQARPFFSGGIMRSEGIFSRLGLPIGTIESLEKELGRKLTSEEKAAYLAGLGTAIVGNMAVPSGGLSAAARAAGSAGRSIAGSTPKQLPGQTNRAGITKREAKRELTKAAIRGGQRTRLRLKEGRLKIEKIDKTLPKIGAKDVFGTEFSSFECSAAEDA